MRIFLAITMLLIIGFMTFWQPESTISFWQDSFAESNALHNKVASRGIASENTTSQASSEKQHNSSDEVRPEDIAEIFVPNPEAIASMNQARLHGDPRAPSLGEHHERETPTEKELGNHEEYLEYERRQQKRVYRAYVDASKIKTAQLRSMIEQGKTEGITEEQIAFAEKKIRDIEEMAITLQQDFPDIMDDSYQPPADWLIENLGKDDNSIESDQTETHIAQ